MTDRIVCPDHGIPDCSPLLNGCSKVTQLHAAATEHADEQEPLCDGYCSGACLTGWDIGLGSGGVDDVAYPHPDCERHGHLWQPFDNEWSRQYVADHPERFLPGSERPR